MSKNHDDDGFEGVRRALTQAVDAADRLALLRTLAWANDGRLALSGLTLSAEEQTLLQRFGLLYNAESNALRLAPENLDAVAPGLSTMLAFDHRERRLYTPAPADVALLRHSTHAHYRNATQKAAIEALMTMPAGAALMVSMPTGSGKSLLFQLAARYWRSKDKGACAIVITPTVALAEDHQRALRNMPGLERCAALTGDITGQAREDIVLAFRRGEIPLLLLSPEAALGESISAALVDAAKPGAAKGGLAARLEAVFIDEAHIVESWGRAFRPDFQRLPALVARLRSFNPELRVVLLSATLDAAARDVLRRDYQQGDWLEIHAGAPRYEFDLFVQPADDEAKRDEDLLFAIDRIPRPAIVYTTRVDRAGDLKRTLASRGYRRLAIFTGETSPPERKRIIDDWTNDRLDLVVATSAFGLGVDKPNVRTIVHACLPESAARYYQEIGRASRDGRQGFALCLWTRSHRHGDKSDETEARRMALGSWLTPELAKARWIALRERASWDWDTTDHRTARLSLDAAHAGLDAHTGQTNRVWNMSLLNLMQRARLIEVIAVSDETITIPAWDIRVLKHAVLEDGAALDAVWPELITLRDSEQAFARETLTDYRDLMSGHTRGCMLRGLYKLIEPEPGSVPRCGRCPNCREARITPPTEINLKGLDRAWPPPTSQTPREPLLIAPDHPNLSHLNDLAERLALAGIEQFIVPDGAGDAIAHHLLQQTLEFGFVHELSDWIDPNRRFAALPTAALLADADGDCAEAWLAQTHKFHEERPGAPLLLVARPDMKVGGRLLQVLASKISPYNEVRIGDLGVRF